MSESPVTLRLSIRGRVQGVGFRAFVAEEAYRRGVRGWVRNRRDGSVEAVVAGPKDAADGVIEACRRGPLGSRVVAVDVEDAGAADAPAGASFDVRPTE